MTSEAEARELHRRDLVRRQSGLVTLRAHRFSGLVRRNGLRAAAFASRIMVLVLPLTCVYYPVSVLPDGLQAFAWALPPTSVFRGDARVANAVYVPGRPYDSGTWPECRVVRGCHCCVSGAARLGAAQRLAGADWRIIHQLRAGLSEIHASPC